MNTSLIESQFRLEFDEFTVNPELTREQFMSQFSVANPNSRDDYKFNAELARTFDEYGIEAAEFFAVVWMPEE